MQRVGGKGGAGCQDLRAGCLGRQTGYLGRRESQGVVSESAVEET